MGLLRIFLAFSVIAGHAETTIFGYHGIGAWYAVNFFFIISGFYMAMILNEKYRDLEPINFYKSRAFRLFPAYYAGTLIAIFVSYGAISNLFGQLSFGTKIYFILQNIFIFGQDLNYVLPVSTAAGNGVSPIAMTINPPAWSLAVELGFYLLAPFILKSEKKTLLFILVGALYLLSLNKIDFPIDGINYARSVDLSGFVYFFYPSSFIFFGSGAMAYHLSKKRWQPQYLGILITIAITMVILSYTRTVMPFSHMLLAGAAIPILFKYTARNRLDRSIGELSYPVYIVHYPIILFIRPFTQSHPQYFNYIGLGSWVAILSCIIGLLIYLFIEKRVNLYRKSKEFFNSIPAKKLNFRNRSFAVVLSIYLSFPIAAVAYVYAAQGQAPPIPPASTPYNLTDQNWINGVGKNFAGFFVSNSRANRNHFKVDRSIKFADGDTRKIVRIEQTISYLNVFLSGAPLNGTEVGFPKIIELVE